MTGPSPIFAVITGDIVRSRSLDARREEVLTCLKGILRAAERFGKEKRKVLFSEIYRGDSFQGVIADPQQALRIALFIRAELLKIRRGVRVEARLAVGFGTIDHLSRDRIEESDGEAFRLSGRALDGMKSYRRLAMAAPDPTVGRTLTVLAALVDVAAARWTVEQAEVVALWLQGLTQEAISGRIAVSQPAVQQRLKTAGVYALEEVLDFLPALLAKK